ncbi:response regulator [Tautonia marina]|uniref:response regulator n=1 Tax=Tautonia marina TaxID=2653855 RepID=UPI0012612CE2|nr:response regulator [Tautonia marina]
MTAPHKPCLLVVDDEPEVCNSVSHLLRHKYHVLRAHSAAEAIELMAQHEVEIIMTDQRMPEVSGVEMLQKVKSRYPEAIRMLFTGYADINSVIAAINQGHVYRYLSKPWQPEELEAAVDDAAAEYRRLVEWTEELVHCQERIADLEQENQQLRALLKDRP